jgi:hypothetical protein
MTLDNLRIRNSFSKLIKLNTNDPLLLAEYNNSIYSKGIEDSKSIQNLPLRYCLAIIVVFVISFPVVSSK